MKNLKIQLFISIIITILMCGNGNAFSQTNSIKTNIANGEHWLDTKGKIVNAHGGGFLKIGNFYYWVGENRHDDVLVSCYRSTDLMNWEFRGDLLTRSSNPELLHANIERPKVIYNETTKQFVMWMHYELSRDYSYARAAVAISSDIEKPFTYLKSFRPFGNMSRDCTLYKDEDGTAYFLSAARENYDMMLYKLTDDYLDTKEQLATLWPGGHREAPALVKRGDYYFLMTSGCTGWAPNQAKFAFSKSVAGPWSQLQEIGNSNTFNTQSTYILPIKGNKTTSYLYVGDRWDGKQFFNSKNIFLPLTFLNDSTMNLNWHKQLTPSLLTGELLIP